MEKPRRTAEQVIASAAAMDRARAAGLPDDLLIILLNARRAWWTGDGWPPDHDLGRVLAHPASRVADEVVVAAIRRRLHR